MKTYPRLTLFMMDTPKILYDRFSVENTCEGQCDCACATGLPMYHEPALPVVNEAYAFNPGEPLLVIPLTDQHDTVLGRDIPPIVLNRSARVIANHFSRGHLLEDIPPLWQHCWGTGSLHSILNQMIEIGLLVPESDYCPEFHENPAVLSAWLHITDRCNLRCRYCYLSHKSADMSIETGRAAIEATFRSARTHGYQQVKFKYAGGEPLLRFFTITELHQYARGLAEQEELELDGVVLSNGTLLTPDIVTQIRTLGLRLMISLDGIGGFHNSHRSYPDGHGSFESVSKAIEMPVSQGLVPEISLTISGRNIEGLPEVVAWVLERELPFSLNFYREHDLSSSKTDLQLEEEKIIGGMLAAYKVIESNLPQRSLLNSLIDRANFAAPHLRTCNVGQDYLVFNSQGCVAKCQMEPGTTITDVHDPDPLARIRKSTQGVQNRSVEEKEECHVCQWRYWCGGGCPLLTYRTTGRYDLKSPNCTIYKALYPEVIRLEGLRLLHYAQ